MDEHRAAAAETLPNVVEFRGVPQQFGNVPIIRDLRISVPDLPGGMRQRVAIARTLILSPRIILMDEPFGALDPTTRLHMQELIVELWREAEATVFFVTHSIEEAVYLGDRVYIFSSAPGTIIKEMEVPAPDRPPEEAQREP